MIRATSILFWVFFDICLLRSRPQSLPNSLELLTVCIIVYTIVNFVLALYTTTPPAAAMASIMETLLVAMITLAVLKLHNHTERWLKTLMALVGTGCIVGLFAVPLFYGSTQVEESQILQAVILLFYIGLLTWNIVIMAHILRHAMDTTIGVGVVFALVYILITSLVIAILLPSLEY